MKPLPLPLINPSRRRLLAGLCGASGLLLAGTLHAQPLPKAGPGG